MTDSDELPEGKRERLIASAAELMYRRGVDSPTLAEIARAAGVPPGNVYYYFKTRDELVTAVVADRLAGVQELLQALDQVPDPSTRLKALARVWLDNEDAIATYGCPMGTLCSELNKRPGADVGAAAIFSTSAQWITNQLRQLGQPHAPDLAMTMLATVQGAAVLASTLRDPTILTSQIGRLERWIDSLAPPAHPSPSPCPSADPKLENRDHA